MATTQELQSLLRFLSQDAKVPLAQAMSKVKDLQSAHLITPAEISKTEFAAIKAIFTDDKLSKQVHNAAKRISKKRGSASDGVIPSPVKREKPLYGQPLSPAQFEASLELPDPCYGEDELSQASVHTNRAPLVLAFAVTLLKHTMPFQPLSSRLSLAQAVVSANSRTKAISIGLESGKSAEDEGWGEGQPVVKVMGREIRVMKRWGYQWDATDEEGGTQETLTEETNEDKKEVTGSSVDEVALWGVDLEALKKANGPTTVTNRNVSTSQLPIYTAQSARAYLLKAFETPKKDDKKSTKKKASSIATEKEHNLSLLLGALDLLMQSWSSILSIEDLDKRAWGWYVNVRPQVEAGAAGWGSKGNIRLADILALRRVAD
ncbi:hypothetical protein B0J11DRAFT_45109 [Dendryphion nanum]|uniref:Impact N-terminal domain-containing protein n=1 Tax=Dendryphion nanum TaxID=256645 RepID=A0A9P9EKI7_9PLEO|nr:hypothetical protein B0J11DRAFT_45109 [Dendryphion nanum]